jgi:predicted dehydrogenase
MKDLRVAVWGTGWMGSTHAKNLTALGAKVVGVCGSSVDKAEAFIGKYGLGSARACRDFDALLGSGADAVVVAVPPYVHGGETERAAEKGMHLLLEKPIEKDLVGAMRIVAAVEKAGVVAVVGHHMRFGAGVRRVAELVRSGEAGTVTLVQGRYFANALHGPWWRDVSKSGGQLVEQAIHLADLACLLAGKPTWVCGQVANLTKSGVPGYTVEDTSALLARFASGAMATLCASNAAVPKQWTCDLRLVCRNLTAELISPDEAVIHYSDGRPSEEYWASGAEVRVEKVEGKTELYPEVARAFVESVRTGRVVSEAATVRQSYHAQQVVAGAMASADNGGQPVTLG